MSFLSIISEEACSYSQDRAKAYAYSSTGPQTLEYDYSETDEMLQKSASQRGQNMCGTSDYSLLIENLYVLESTFADSDVLRLEREILQQLGRLGALKLFNACLSRTPKTSSIFNLSDVPVVHVEEHTMKGTVETHKGKIIIHSKRKEKRKSRTERVSGKSSKTSLLSLPSEAVCGKFQRHTVSLMSRELNSRSRRSMIARNEAEMSKGVKVVSEF